MVTLAKRLKVKINHLYMSAADSLYFKICYNRFAYFQRKIPKGNLMLNEEISSKSAKKEFLVLL